MYGRQYSRYDLHADLQCGARYARALTTYNIKLCVCITHINQTILHYVLLLLS